MSRPAIIRHYNEAAKAYSDALAGLERWKERHPAAAVHLTATDVLVDAMRGRFTTWTRIRLNLRNVPEQIRPSQETPDPDEDPIRAWREGRGTPR